MLLYHETRPENEAPIIANGFRDCSSVMRPDGKEWRGVWVADVPIRNRSHAVVFEIQTDFTKSELDSWKPYRDRPDYREWLIPAARLNACPVRVIERR